MQIACHMEWRVAIEPVPCKDQKQLDAALLAASGEGHLDRMRRYVKQGVDVHAKDEYGCTALHIVSLKGKVEAMRVLVTELGFGDLYAKDNLYDDNALHKAALNGKSLAIRVLVKEQGFTDVHAKKQYGHTAVTALHKACYGGHVEAMRVLVKDLEHTEVYAKHGSGQTNQH